MIKKIFTAFFLISFCQIFSQEFVFEYNEDYDVNFKIFTLGQNKMSKIDDFNAVDKSSPEGLAQSYFFASNDDWNKSNYLENENIDPKKPSHYEQVKKLDPNKNSIVLLHKLLYNYAGNEMCTIMFIANLEGINFKFPTTLSCIKKDNVWYIYNLSNQYKLNEIMLTFKSFRILQLIEGKNTNSLRMTDLIKNTRNKNNILDINKLYAKKQEWKKLDDNQKFFTNVVNNESDDADNFELKGKKINFSSVYKDVHLKIFKKSDQKSNIDLLNQIKADHSINDSIYLSSKLDIENGKDKYSIVKYKIINSSNTSKFKTKALYNSSNKLSESISKLSYIFENLNAEIFSDLSPTTDNKLSQESVLYKLTRGSYDNLNIDLLYELLNKNKSLFTKYLEK